MFHLPKPTHSHVLFAALASTRSRSELMIPIRRMPFPLNSVAAHRSFCTALANCRSITTTTIGQPVFITIQIESITGRNLKCVTLWCASLVHVRVCRYNQKIAEHEHGKRWRKKSRANQNGTGAKKLSVEVR